MKRKRRDDRSELEMWQSVDTWADHTPAWAKKKEPYRNPWEIKSHGGSEEEITGRPVFPRKKILRKTPRRWCELLLFYLLFYGILFGFSIGLFYLYFYAIKSPPDEPSYVDIIGRSVGISVYPKMQEGDDVRNNGSMLEYIAFEKRGNAEMKMFLRGYSVKATKGVSCSFTSSPPKDKACNFDMSELGPCSSPFTETCLYLKVTRTINRVPKEYLSEEELPKKFPQDLKTIYKSTPANERKRVWVRCEKEDSDKLNGSIKEMKYFPSHSSFPGYFFPFKQQKDYQDPLVAVKLEVTGKIQLHCKAWDKSVDPTDKSDASISFIFFAIP